MLNYVKQMTNVNNLPTWTLNLIVNNILHVYNKYIYIKMEPKMYNNSSIENGWADLAQIFFKLFVIARRRFLRKKILEKL